MSLVKKALSYEDSDKPSKVNGTQVVKQQAAKLNKWSLLWLTLKAFMPDFKTIALVVVALNLVVPHWFDMVKSLVQSI
jgi:hypothetical protein